MKRCKRQDGKGDKPNGSGMRIREDQEEEERNVISPSQESSCEWKENYRVVASVRARLFGQNCRPKRRKQQKKQTFKIRGWMLKPDSEGCRSRQGGTDGWLVQHTCRSSTLLVTVEEGWICQWVWKLKEVKAVKLNGLMFFSHIQGKGISWHLGMETAVRSLRLTTEWALTREHMGGSAEPKTHKFVRAPISTIVWFSTGASGSLEREAE